MPRIWCRAPLDQARPLLANGPVECFNRTIKETTVQGYHYESTAQLHEYLQTFLLVYHHAKRLKRLYGLNPHEFVCAQWQKNSTIFTSDPTRLTRGICI